MSYKWSYKALSPTDLLKPHLATLQFLAVFRIEALHQLWGLREPTLLWRWGVPYWATPMVGLFCWKIPLRSKKNYDWLGYPHLSWNCPHDFGNPLIWCVNPKSENKKLRSDQWLMINFGDWPTLQIDWEWSLSMNWTPKANDCVF